MCVCLSVCESIYRVRQKSKPAYSCNNFVYCQPVFIIFGTYIYTRKKFATGDTYRPRHLVSPPNVAGVRRPGRVHLCRVADNTVYGK